MSGLGCVLKLADDDDDDFVIPSDDQAKNETAIAGGLQTRGTPFRGEGDAGAVLPARGLKLNSTFSLNKVHSLFSAFDGEKKVLVESIGFGGLLAMYRQPKISRRLAYWLLQNMDPSSSTIVTGDGTRVKITSSDVQLILGFPRKVDGSYRWKHYDARAYDVVKSILGLGRNSDITMDYVESLLTKDYGGIMSTKERNAFKVAVVLFVDAYFLAPKSAPPKVNHSILPYLVEPNSIHEVNWGRYVLDVVREASRRVKRSSIGAKKVVSLDCCLILLMIFYLNSLESGSVNPSCLSLPRIADFPYEKIKNIISQDQETSMEVDMLSCLVN